MADLELFKTQVYELMVTKLGEPGTSDMVFIRREAKACGLNDRQLDRLLQEVYSSINWTKIRDEREGEQRVEGAPISIFDTQVKSLQKLGEVLFDHPKEALKYLSDDVLLKANVNYLSGQNIDIAIAFSDLYHSEKDKDSRYLKICYQLNPKLPYRIGEELFKDLDTLLTAGFRNRALMNRIYKDYSQGKLHIWLQARDPQGVSTLPVDRDVLTFLTFIYATQKSYPFLIEEESFGSPLELAVRAQKELDLWPKLIKCYGNGTLLVWFDALGYQSRREELQQAWETAAQNTLLDDTEKAYAFIQGLLSLIDPELCPPSIITDQEKIEQLALPATEVITLPIKITLKTPGFLAVPLRLQPPIAGMQLAPTKVTLFDLTQQEQETINLLIDPQQLKKNIVYETAVQIADTTIPVQIKTVFPIRAFGNYLLKYAILGALFLGFFRWLLSACTAHSGSLAPFIITTEISRSLPDNYGVFFAVFVGLLGSLAISVLLMIKKEKL